MKISIASDHTGKKLKEKIKKYLYSLSSFQISDKGCHSDIECDYTYYAHAVAKDIQKNNFNFGIIITDTGNGVNMCVNKWESIRAALCWNNEISKKSRLYNDANILIIPSSYITKIEAIEAVKNFIETPFEYGKHQSKIEKIKKPLEIIE